MKYFINYIKVYGGIGIGFLVFVVLLVLKLTNVIDWSWWWIVAPLLILLSLDLFLSVVYVLYQLFFLKKDKREEE